MRVAARVARDKEENPGRYCPSRGCLWRTGGGPCPRHPEVEIRVERVAVDPEVVAFAAKAREAYVVSLVEKFGIARDAAERVADLAADLATQAALYGVVDVESAVARLRGES